MRIALAQVNITIGRFSDTAARYRSIWERAREAGAQLLVLPELATTGYPPKDLLADSSFIEANLALLGEMASWTANGPAILMGYVEPNSGPGADFFNAAAMLDNGFVESRRHKTLLPTYDVFDEHRYFQPAPERTPIEWHGLRLGVTICEDIWVDDAPATYAESRYRVDPSAELAAQGVDVFINLSASPFTLGKASTRRRLVADIAKTHGRPALYVNQVGAHDELIFDGHSIAVDASGRVTARMADFEEDFILLDGLPNPGQPELPLPQTSSGGAVAAEWQDEAYRALKLGLHDYVRKSGFEQVIIGLSGGIDSALTATLAADALGADNVWTVAMPTRYSSDHSLTDAKALAENLGLRHVVQSIDDGFQAMLDQLSPLFEGRNPDIAEENIQARLRGVTLMALSNKFGALVLCTSNKSEAAVGYTTLYGDMCGALAVIADVTKTRVYELAKWINRERERIPVHTITKPPSAELRPNQTDQDTLPEYDVVDAIVDRYVEQHLSVGEIARETGFDTPVVAEIVRKINLSEYKRRQAAPTLKITSKAFGVGRRMPIVAGYDRAVWERARGGGCS